MCDAHTTDVCLEYFEKMRRQVYQTPKSYLSFIAAYQVMYGDSASEVELWEDGVHATSRHCDAVDVALRACTEAVSRRSRRRYKTKLAEIEHKEASILLGLEKLEQGAKDVEDMKVVLAEEDKKLAVASEGE